MSLEMPRILRAFHSLQVINRKTKAEEFYPIEVVPSSEQAIITLRLGSTTPDHLYPEDIYGEYHLGFASGGVIFGDDDYIQLDAVSTYVNTELFLAGEDARVISIDNHRPIDGQPYTQRHVVPLGSWEEILRQITEDQWPVSQQVRDHFKGRSAPIITVLRN